MCKNLTHLISALAVSLAVLAPTYADVIWDFENGNDHGFTLWSVNPAAPAADDPATAGDEALTGAGGPNALPDAGVAWAIGRPDQYDGFKPPVQEGDKIKADGTMEYNQPGLNHPFTFPINGRGQQSYLNTYNLTQWGDNLHTQQNDQIATSRLVLLGNGSVLTAWVHGGGSGTHAPELDPNPNEGYTNGSAGVAVLSAADGSLLESVLTNGHGNLRQDTIDLSAYAGQEVYIEVVDAFQGGWGWIAVDEIRITNATELIAPPGQASDPNPADEALNVCRRPVLSWTPGEYAQKHDVYFGTDFDDVNNATTAVDPHGFYKGRQDPNQYPISGTLDLEYGKTYYWRIDEVNAPPDLTMYKGQVWQFTVETFAYPIPGEKMTATASSLHNENMRPENTINGSGLDENDLHSTEDDAMWLSSGVGPQPTWIQYEFDRAYKLYEMWVWNFNQSFEPAVGFGLKEVTIEYSANGVNWTELGGVPEFAQGPGMDGYAHNTVVSFDGAVAKYVKITANSNWGGLAQYGLSEVRFFYVPVWAREPNPQNGATGVGVDNTTVSWRAGREAASHKVYFSTSREAVVDETISPVSIPADSSYASYDTGELDLGRTYYWKVNEVNDAETPTTWKGDTWSFAVLDYLVVDDMETYGSADIPGQPGSRIWYTWNDGYGWTTPAPGNHGNNTGAIVDANSATVHGDKQSLRIDYDNDGTFSNIYGEPKNPYHSEVKREWTTPQDWTRNGIKALTVWFYGAAANAAEQLYVALEDNAGHVKVVNYSDLEAVRVPVWQEWNIALSEFSAAGVNLKAVKKMYIGLGNRTSPKAGGTGKIYIDDIRLYPSRCIPELSKSAGDINNDCIVDFSDYAIMASDWLLNDYSIPAAPITKTPVAHWALDEGSGTTASDSAGGHHGAIKGGVGTTWVAGKVGNYALHFNGEDNHYVDCGTFNPAQGTNEMTCAVWAKSDGANGNWQGLVCKRDSWSVSGMMWQIEVNMNDQRVGAFRNGVNGEANRLYTLEPLPEGEWQHIAFTINNANDTALYVDGEVVDTANWSLGTGTDAHVLIGATFYQGETGQDCFNGALDDVYLFNSDLTQGQIIKLMGLNERYFPIESPAELYDVEPQNSRSINLRDLEVLADSWLEEQLWP
jgi:hypothetical protein